MSYEYYDWSKTLSYDAEVNIIITARGRGKTYGIRAQAISDYLRTGERFVEICRYKAEMRGVMSGYFDRLGNDPRYCGYRFRIDKQQAYIAKANNENHKPEWKPFGYFVALTDQQALKKHTFDNVRRIIYDEALLDTTDRMHHYLPNEYDILTNLVDTVTRQRPGEKTRSRLYLLGNAVDISNPFFRRLGINKPPAYGYTWHNGHTCLLHYEDPGTWASDRAKSTLVGHMAGSSISETNFANRFSPAGEGLIERKTSNAKCQYGIRYAGVTYGIWYDYAEGLVYILPKVTKTAPIYALTTSDNSINYLVVNRSSVLIRSLVDIYCSGLVRFDTQGTLETFRRIFAMYGIRY